MQNKTILLVEDSPDDVLLTRRALQKNHIANEVVVVNDGEQALDYLFGQGKYASRDLTDKPALILLDINLPKLNGIEVLKEIRSHTSTKMLPVTILTSSNEEQDLIEAYSLGANSYIRKPVDFNQFIDAVQKLGMYWLLLNELPWGRE